MNANVSISIGAVYALGTILFNRWLYAKLHLVDPEITREPPAYFDRPVVSRMLLDFDLPKDFYPAWFRRSLYASRALLLFYPVVLMWAVLIPD
ncbi:MULTISPECIES: hypothetical protein [Dyella]|uniref:Uncharacterized protein n=2 Tax=Dyella TaxID=231454 RepID=A0A4R0YM80_9GAMM|nr:MULTISPECIES: hypothetical protein [Dyella]TBR35854.1 hypothetical protein EYV96_17835 [Dyella terrae]TCI08598.1 hypothetical protein EZM97_28720 [Dyella soli]